MMPDREKVIKGLENCITGFDCPPECPYLDDCNDLIKPMFVELAKDALALLKEQEARIKKYEYVFDFLGIGFREWATKILNGEAEVICEADEHERKTVITFKLI